MKRGQVWVETVIYTLIAFVMIGSVLAFVKPKVEEMQDKAIIEQSIGMMEDINTIVLSLVHGGAGNKRKIELGIKKGILMIDGQNNKLIFEIESGNTYTEIQNFERVYINFTPSIPPLKKVKDKTTINVRYCVIEPFAYIHIYWDPKISEVIYKIEEPVLSREESKYLEQLLLAMRSLINYDSVVENDQESLLDHIDKRLKFLAVELGMTMDYESYKKIYYYLCRDFIGFNEIEPLLRDYFVEDIECNGGTTPVYLVHRVFRNLKTTLVYKDLDKLGGFVEKLAQRCGKYISYADPILDGSLPDGSRVNATYTKDIYHI